MRVLVYVDVLICVNFILNYALLLPCAKISGRRPRRARLLLSALAGALASLIIFAGSMPLPLSVGYKLCVSLVMMLIAFGFGGIRQLLKEWLIFFTVSFLFGGIMLAISVGMQPSSLLYYNGIVYFDISLFSLLIFTTVAYLLVGLFNRIYRSQSLGTGDYKVKVDIFGASRQFRGRVDTGNMLTDVFSDTPVSVCCTADMTALMPLELRTAFEPGVQLDLLCDIVAQTPFRSSFRLISYRDVSGTGLMPAFRADKITLHGEDGVRVVENVFVAMTDQPIGDGSYDFLLSPRMTAIKKQKAGALR